MRRTTLLCVVVLVLLPLAAACGESSSTAPGRIDHEPVTLPTPEEYLSDTGEVRLVVEGMKPARGKELIPDRKVWFRGELHNNTGQEIGIWLTVVPSPDWNPGMPGETGPWSAPCRMFDPGEHPSMEGAVLKFIGDTGRSMMSISYVRMMISVGKCELTGDHIETLDGLQLNWKGQ